MNRALDETGSAIMFHVKPETLFANAKPGKNVSQQILHGKFARNAGQTEVRET